ncbi:unnamed protein product [Closterium sp. NIES-65]|nr:unnamed protein product [Closterium sp. NIES-65]
MALPRFPVRFFAVLLLALIVVVLATELFTCDHHLCSVACAHRLCSVACARRIHSCSPVLCHPPSHALGSPLSSLSVFRSCPRLFAPLRPCLPLCPAWRGLCARLPWPVLVGYEKHQERRKEEACEPVVGQTGADSRVRQRKVEAHRRGLASFLFPPAHSDFSFAQPFFPCSLVFSLPSSVFPNSLSFPLCSPVFPILSSSEGAVKSRAVRGSVWRQMGGSMRQRRRVGFLA